MPSFCNGHLTITCSEDMLNQIKEYVRSEETVFDFNRIIPMPAPDDERYPAVKQYERDGEINWADWSCDHWGTPWKATKAYLTDMGFFIETGWSACGPVIEALAAHFPEATMRYTYSGPVYAGYCGVDEYRNGVLVYSLRGYYCDYCLEFEDAGPMIPPDIMEMPDAAGYNERFIPVSQEGNTITGQLYLREASSASSGFEIIANVSFDGKPPACWIDFHA